MTCTITSHPFSPGDWWETGRPPTKIFELGDWLPVLSTILGARHGATMATSAYHRKFQLVDIHWHSHATVLFIAVYCYWLEW